MSRIFFKTSAFLVLIIIVVSALFWWTKVPWKKHFPNEWFLPHKEELKFLVLSDFGTGKKKAYKVTKALEDRCQETQPDGLILLGDNSQKDGFTSIDDPNWRKQVFKPLDRPCLNGLPKYAILGNHDYKGNPVSEILMTDHDPGWVMPHRFYSLRFGTLLQITAIDTVAFDVCGNSELCTIDFLKKSLEKSTADWNIVIGHHPLEASANFLLHLRRLPRRLIFQTVAKEPICTYADAYLSGHMHFLEHRKLKNCETDQFIVGGGGARLYDVSEAFNPETLFTKKTRGFLEIRITKNKIIWKFFDNENKQVYEAESIKE